MCRDNSAARVAYDTMADPPAYQYSAESENLRQAARLDSQAGVTAAHWKSVLIGERPAGRESPWPSLRPAKMAGLAAAFLQTLGRTR